MGDLTFSPAGDRFVYSATAKKGTHLVVDGVEQGCWKDIEQVRFSPDGRRLVYLASMGVYRRLVLDGRAGPPALDFDHVQFSPDGRHLVAVASKEGGQHLLVDDYRSAACICPPSTIAGHHSVVQAGFTGAKGVYAVTMSIDPLRVAFDRLDVEWQ